LMARIVVTPCSKGRMKVGLYLIGGIYFLRVSGV